MKSPRSVLFSENFPQAPHPQTPTSRNPTNCLRLCSSSKIKAPASDCKKEKRRKKETGFLEFLTRLNKTNTFAYQGSQASQRQLALEIEATEIVLREGGPLRGNRRRASLFPFFFSVKSSWGCERSRNPKEMAGIADFAVDIVAIAWVMTPGDGFGGVMKLQTARLTKNGWCPCPCPVCLRAHFFVRPSSPIGFSEPPPNTTRDGIYTNRQKI